MILPKPRTYYRANIHTRYVEPGQRTHLSDGQYSSHWQLRSLISSPEQDVIYYPSGRDIYALYTKTKERELITRLPFSPRCVTTERGWLCCGGENGNYTAISLSDGNTDLDFSISLDVDPDARLPLNLDPSSRSTPRDTPSGSRRSRGFNHPLCANDKTIGKEINNCITLWFPTEAASERTYNIPVAVVSNNDRTVSVLNLEDSEVLDKLSYPDCVNRAVMSPDGELLVAILDDPFLYIHQRKPKSESSDGELDPKQGYEWAPACRIQLKSQSQSDQTNLRGSFAASFSKSGKYLAVGTQYGVISVFDTETITLEDSEPLVVFTTSRPMQSSGAVRAMEFSPGPFDLLAWTEASGRAGVADLRDLFLSRQLITVDCRLDDMEKVIVSERSGDPVIDPRLRSHRTDSPSSTTPDYLGLDFDRRQLRHLTQEMLDRHHSPLTAEEMEVLQAHRVARRQRDALAEGSSTLSTSTWSRWANGPRLTTNTGTPPNGEGSSSTDHRVSVTGLPVALREFVNPDRTAASIRTFINERNQDRERRGQQPQEPRRRSSIILAAAEQALERETLGSNNDTPNANDTPNNDTSNGLERLTLTPPPPHSPWADIDSFYRARLPADPSADRSTRVRIELEGDDRRDFAHRLRQPWRGLEDLGFGYDENVVLRGVLRTGPANTMGCCWSPDGRMLYVPSLLSLSKQSSLLTK